MENLPPRRTKIIGTIGPASRDTEILRAMIRNGMDVARLNLSHGTLESHAQVIREIRNAASDLGQWVEIWGDLPGSKLRIGRLSSEPASLVPGQQFVLRTGDCVGDATCASVNNRRLSDMIEPGADVYLSDGFVHLRVDRVEGTQILCQVLVGGQLRSNDGMNVPGIDPCSGSCDEQDHTCLAFAAEKKVDAVSPSFVGDASDLDKIRGAAAELNYWPYVLAKVECARAVRNIRSLLESADAIVIARGDLGVETPFEEIALLQKNLIRRAKMAGKPVITATHMLQSMVQRRFPTRAEVADVTNAILDGSDCLALCAETAIGNYPAEAIEVMARIARVTERQIRGRTRTHAEEALGGDEDFGSTLPQGRRDSAFCPGSGLSADRWGG